MLKNAAIKEKLADAMAVEFQRDLEGDDIPPEKIQAQVKRSKKRMTSAPVIILINLDMSEMNVYPDRKRKQAEFRTAVQSVASAGMQLLLAAHAEGLGGVWVCSPLFAQETVQKVLGLPKEWEPHGMFYLGYPEAIPEIRERKLLNEISKFI